MSVTPSYLTFVIDQLAAWGPVETRRMFGGIGLYRDGVFFGLVDDDIVFMKVDDETRPDYEREGMPPFQPVASKPSLVSKNYYQLPEHILLDTEELTVWAKRAYAASRRREAAKQPSAASKRASPGKATQKRKPAAKPKPAPKKTAKQRQR